MTSVLEPPASGTGRARGMYTIEDRADAKPLETG